MIQFPLQMKIVVLFAMTLLGAAVAQNEDRSPRPLNLAASYRKAEKTLPNQGLHFVSQRM